MTGTNGTNGHTNGENGHAVNGNRTGDQFRSYHDDRNATSQETVYCTSNGVPYPHPYEVQRVGENGPLLLQDHHLIDLISHFDRERIPVSSCGVNCWV
jgi:catalase